MAKSQVGSMRDYGIYGLTNAETGIDREQNEIMICL